MHEAPQHGHSNDEHIKKNTEKVCLFADAGSDHVIKEMRRSGVCFFF